MVSPCPSSSIGLKRRRSRLPLGGGTRDTRSVAVPILENRSATKGFVVREAKIRTADGVDGGQG